MTQDTVDALVKAAKKLELDNVKDCGWKSFGDENSRLTIVFGNIVEIAACAAQAGAIVAMNPSPSYDETDLVWDLQAARIAENDHEFYLY